MDSFILRGEIINCETGESTALEHFLFPNEARISAIARIEGIASHVHEDNSLQVSAECKALCSQGSVFELTMEFFPETAGMQEEIVRDLVVGQLFFVAGCYCVLPNERAITIYDADYRPLEIKLAGSASAAFQVNSCA